LASTYAVGAEARTNQTRVLLVTGVDYPAHEWRKTAPVLKEILEQGGGTDVRVVVDPAFLDSAALTN
jgi:hypothetical protein